MADHTYQILQWDSDFFAIKIGRIIPAILEELSLKEILGDMAQQGVNLAYWSSEKRMRADLISKFGGKLVDIKTTLSVDLTKINGCDLPGSKVIRPYSPDMDMMELYSLVRQCGAFSRFCIDRNIPRHKFIELYDLWLQKSLHKEMADEVLVVFHGQQCLGFVTLAEQDGQGDIGLLVVDEKNRGQHYGTQLVAAAWRWFLLRDCKCGRVVTQAANEPAIILYQDCGYSITKQEYFYHFWL